MGRDGVGSERSLGRENIIKVDYMKEILNYENPSNLHSVQKSVVVLRIEPHLPHFNSNVDVLTLGTSECDLFGNQAVADATS